MPNPAATLKLKNFRRRFGIAAPRVIVRSYLGWEWYVFGVMAVVLLIGFAFWAFARQGDESQLVRQIGFLRERLAERDKELARLRANVGTEQNAMQMERSAQQQLLSRVRVLELENATLKEEVSLFERLLPADGSRASIRIERLIITPESEVGRYRYRMLIGFQPSKQERAFKGRLEIRVLLNEEGGERSLTLGKDQENASENVLEVKNFLRKEGSFEIPPATSLKALEVRLLQGEGVKAKRMASL